MLPMNHTVESVAHERRVAPKVLLRAAGEIGISKSAVADPLSDWERERLLSAMTVEAFAEKLDIPPTQLLVELDEIGMPKPSVGAYLSFDEQWEREAARPVNDLARAEDIPADTLLRKLKELGRPKPSARALLTTNEQELLSAFVRAHHVASTIRAVRDYRGLTQTKLAAAVGVSDRQLAKIEAGEVDLAEDWHHEDPKGRLRKLAEALRVEPKDLFGKTDTAAQIRHAESQRQQAVAVRALVTPEARTAFSRIRDRYGWTITQVMELAPLMFGLLAEGSLSRRRRRLEELRSALGGEPGEFPGELHRFLAEFHSEIHEHLAQEENSIRECHLRQDGLSRSGSADPFSAYLFELAHTLDKFDEADMPSAKSPNGELLLRDLLLRDNALRSRCSACHEPIQPNYSYCPLCGEQTDHESPSAYS